MRRWISERALFRERARKSIAKQAEELAERDAAIGERSANSSSNEGN